MVGAATVANAAIWILFNSPEYIFELKWDGIRALASQDATGLRVTDRGGGDLLPAVPELRELPPVVSADVTVRLPDELAITTNISIAIATIAFDTPGPSTAASKIASMSEGKANTVAMR